MYTCTINRQYGLINDGKLLIYLQFLHKHMGQEAHRWDVAIKSGLNIKVSKAMYL